MHPLEAVAQLAPVAQDCMSVLLMLASPKLHGRFKAELPADATSASLRALFDRFARAAAQFDQNEGLLEGADRFVRAARTLRKMSAAMTGWVPTAQDPPDNVVDLARTALRHLGVHDPLAGWDAFEGTPALRLPKL